MKLKGKFKSILKVIGLSMLMYASINSIPTYAAWYNDGYDYVQAYGEVLQYKDGAFWFAQYGQAGGVNSNRYAILGFNTSVSLNGTSYNFSSKVNGTFQVVNERTVGSYVYTLWKLDYNNMVLRFKKAYPYADFSALSSKSAASTFTFNAIMSIKYSGSSTPSGSIDDSGTQLSSPVYRTAQSIIDTGLFYATAQSEIRKLFGISATVPATEKPVSIKPDLIHFSMTGYDYKDADGVYYWVKPGTKVKFKMQASLPKGYGVHPEVMYFKMYKGDLADDIHLTMYNITRTGVIYSWQGGSIGSITQVPNESSVATSSDSTRNIITNIFTTQFQESGSAYSLRYTSTYNGESKAYEGTNMGIKVDGGNPNVSISTTGGVWKNTNISASLSSSDSLSGVAKTEYKLSGATTQDWANYSAALTISNNGKTKIEARSTDRVGNVSGIASKEVWIDKQKPTASIATTEKAWKNTNITATISSSDAISGISKMEYKLSGATTKDWGTYTNGSTITISNSGVTKIEARSTDNAGNVSDVVSKEIWVDKVLPSVSITTTENTWKNSNIAATISTSDANSGISKIEYKLSGATTQDWITYTSGSTITISNNGKTKIEARATDNAGNISSVIFKEVWIDKIIPTISISTTDGVWKNTDIIATISSSDTISSISKMEYRLSGSTTKDWTTYTSGQIITINNNGKTKIEARSTDSAGNISTTVSKEVWIDKTVPTVSISTIEQTWKNEVVSASISASENISSVSIIEYNLTGAMNKDWTEYQGAISINVTGKTTISARAKDLAGNVSATVSKEVWFDSVVPEGVFSTNAKTTTRQINININSLKDINSGVKEVLISNDSNFTAPSKYSLLGKESSTVAFTLDKKSTAQSNYSVRTIYIRLYDNVLNYKNYQITTELIPASPDKPIISLPKENNKVFVNGEKVTLKWKHNDNKNDFVLPQTKAVILLVNEDTNKRTTVDINGDANEYSFNFLEYGEYTAYVSTYNFGPNESSKSEIKFRYNKFLTDGLVRTIKIQGEYNLKYILVELLSEIPEGTSVEGKIYYKYNSSGVIDTSKFIKFAKDSLNKIIKLPEKSQTIQVDLIMKNSTNPINPYISPLLDEIRLYAK